MPHGTSSTDAQKTGTGVLKKSVLYKTAQSSGIEMVCHPGLNRFRLQFSSAYFLFSGRVDGFYHTRNVRALKKGTCGGEYWSVFHGRDLCHSLNSFVFVESVGGDWNSN